MTHRGILVITLLLTNYSASFLVPLRKNCPGMVLSSLGRIFPGQSISHTITQGLNFPYQSGSQSIKFPKHLPINLFDADNFLVGVSFSQGTLVCVKLKKITKLTSTSVFKVLMPLGVLLIQDRCQILD